MFILITVMVVLKQLFTIYAWFVNFLICQRSSFRLVIDYSTMMIFYQMYYLLRIAFHSNNLICEQFPFNLMGQGHQVGEKVHASNFMN